MVEDGRLKAELVKKAAEALRYKETLQMKIKELGGVKS